MARVGRLKRDRARPCQEHDVDDVGQRHVAVVRAFVIAPAQMHPHPLRRDPRQRMVQRLDMQPRPLAEFLDRQIGVLDVPPHREIGAIDLQRDPGPGDRLVLAAHRLGDRKQIRLLVRVVIVAEEQRDDAGRGGAEKTAGRVHRSQRGFQMLDIGQRRRRVGDSDRPGAGRRLAPRASGVAEHALREPRELRQILIDKGVAGPAKAGHPVFDIGGIARFRHLAVIDQVDAGIGLLLDDLGNRFADARRQRGGIDRHAFLLCEHHADQIIGPRQAAGMRRQKPLRPQCHVSLRSRAVAWFTTT